MKWQKVKLGALYEVHNGLSKPRDSFGSGFPFLSYSTVFNNFFLPDLLDSLVMTDEKEQSSYSIKEGDVFITRTSETSDELGMSCVALKDYPHATYNGFCKRLRPITKEVFPRYIGYYLRAPEFRSRFDGLGAAMITRASLKNEDLLAMTVALPPLPIQRKIAEILGAYDDLIENNRRRIALLEKMARELYRERFVRRAGKTSKRVMIADVCSRIGSGGTPSRKESSYWEGGNVDWFKTKELMDDWLVESEEKITEEGLSNSSAKVFEKNTVVMAIYASPTVGRLGIMSKCACTNQAALGLVANEEVVSWQWLFFLLQDKRDYFNRIAAGAGQQNISAEVVKKCEFDLPEKMAIDEFTAIVAPMFDERLSLALQNRNLARQRDRLLPRLLSGRLEVRV